MNNFSFLFLSFVNHSLTDVLSACYFLFRRKGVLFQIHSTEQVAVAHDTDPFATTKTAHVYSCSWKDFTNSLFKSTHVRWSGDDLAQKHEYNRTLEELHAE